MTIVEIAYTLPQSAANVTQAGLEVVPERILTDTIRGEDVEVFAEEDYARVLSEKAGLIVPRGSLLYIKYKTNVEGEE